MNKKARYIRLLILVFISLAFELATLAQEEGTPQPDTGIVITNVSSENKSFDPIKEKAIIQYKLSNKALVSVKIYDRDDFLIRKLVTNEPADGGYNTVAWDGKDDSGGYLPPGSYTYLIEATSLDSKKTVLFDRTDESYGKELTLRSLSYDAKTGKIEYVLPNAAMLRIRVGIKDGGPLLATLVDWQPQEAGRHQYIWDGNIGVNGLNLQSDPSIQFNLAAYSLPDNSIIVGYSKPPEEGFSESKLETIEKRAKKESPFKKYLHTTHPKAACREPKLEIEFPNVSEYTQDGLPLLTGVVPVRIIVDDQDKKFLQDERYEVIFFVDFVFLHEEEEGISPINYLFDTRGMSEGIHLLTVNLNSFKDHIGTKTKQVFVKRIKQ